MIAPNIEVYLFKSFDHLNIKTVLDSTKCRLKLTQSTSVVLDHFESFPFLTGEELYVKNDGIAIKGVQNLYVRWWDHHISIKGQKLNNSYYRYREEFVVNGSIVQEIVWDSCFPWTDYQKECLPSEVQEIDNLLPIELKIYPNYATVNLMEKTLYKKDTGLIFRASSKSFLGLAFESARILILEYSSEAEHEILTTGQYWARFLAGLRSDIESFLKSCIAFTGDTSINKLTVDLIRYANLKCIQLELATASIGARLLSMITTGTGDNVLIKSLMDDNFFLNSSLEEIVDAINCIYQAEVVGDFEYNDFLTLEICSKISEQSMESLTNNL